MTKNGSAGSISTNISQRCLTVDGANAGTAATVKCPTECPLMLRRLQACPQPQEGYQYGEAPKDECGCTTGCPPIVKASATKKRNTVQEKGGR